jgi:hypothetical protein
MVPFGWPDGFWMASVTEMSAAPGQETVAVMQALYWPKPVGQAWPTFEKVPSGRGAAPDPPSTPASAF